MMSKYIPIRVPSSMRWMLHVGVHTYICVCMTYVISYVMSSYVYRLAVVLKGIHIKEHEE